MKTLQKNGGWYRDRTCDPYHVKVVTLGQIIELYRGLEAVVLGSFITRSHVSWAIMGAPPFTALFIWLGRKGAVNSQMTRSGRGGAIRDGMVSGVPPHFFHGAR